MSDSASLYPKMPDRLLRVKFESLTDVNLTANDVVIPPFQRYTLGKSTDRVLAHRVGGPKRSRYISRDRSIVDDPARISRTPCTAWVCLPPALRYLLFHNLVRFLSAKERSSNVQIDDIVETVQGEFFEWHGGGGHACVLRSLSKLLGGRFGDPRRAAEWCICWVRWRTYVEENVQATLNKYQLCLGFLRRIIPNASRAVTTEGGCCGRMDSEASSPKSFATIPNKASTNSGLAKSPTTIVVLSDRVSPIILTVSSNASRRRPVRITVHPCLLSSIAAARPMPEDAPVTRAMLVGEVWLMMGTWVRRCWVE